MILDSSNDVLASRENDPSKLNGTFDSDLSYEELLMLLWHSPF
jgi:hypothetical protein